MQTENLQAITIENLCSEYSTESRYIGRHTRLRGEVEKKMNAQFSKLQSVFRRKLTLALAGSGSSVMRAHVWASVDHSKRPVTVLPIASAAILIRKGVEVHLSFIATTANITAETGKLMRAAAAFNS